MYDIQDIEMLEYNEIIHEIPFTNFFFSSSGQLKNTKQKSSFIPFCLADVCIRVSRFAKSKETAVKTKRKMRVNMHLPREKKNI